MLLTFNAQVISDWLFLSILDFLLGFCFILKTSKKEQKCWSQGQRAQTPNRLAVPTFGKASSSILVLLSKSKIRG